ncbi:BlaI/MecI/CopY family transcriptional regulator [Hyphomonas sp.]|uniref:BlaI/MecI/CopY family transcriptional regulator n=1 Tax=Hyphomonas sp. TaxID=87 RepID=UPI0025BEC3B5|nr:BlaI/MecI/CopY family transcriptional regulator [Hyphomonas sp.]
MSVRTRKIALGPLEIAIMKYLWRRGPADVKAVHLALGGDDGQTHNTVQSAMERLFKKGLLSRDKVSHAYVYRAEVSRSQIIGRVMDDVLRSLSPESKSSYLLAFLDHAADADSEALDTLERLIREKREEAGGGGLDAGDD